MVISAKRAAPLVKKRQYLAQWEKKRQTKGTNSESKQNSGILRYGNCPLNQKLPSIQNGIMVRF